MNAEKGTGWGRFAKNRRKGKTFFDRKNQYQTLKEKKNPYETEVKQKPDTMPEIEKNYRICRRVYQSLFIEIASTFIQYINTLSPDEIDQLDDDIRPNGWGAQFIVEIENSVKLLHIFQMLYYFNGKLPLTNELLPVSDGKTREGSENIYENFVWIF